MIVDEFIVMLQAIDPPCFKLVQGIGELAQVKDAPPAYPAAYVFIKEEAAGENERMSGAGLQRIEVDIGVVLVTRNVSDNTGAAASRDIEALKVIAKATLAGSQPASADDTVDYVGGQLVRARSGYVWWELTFSAPTYLEHKP